MGCPLSKKSGKDPEIPTRNVQRRTDRARARADEEFLVESNSSDGHTQSGSNIGGQQLDKSKTWTDEQLLAELKHLDRQTSLNIVKMFDDGSTIPFMCRYRRELIANLTPDE